MANATLDEVYERLCDTGPEFDGWLSNHAPMAAEALIHHGHADRVHRWLDDYRRNLEPRPRGISPLGAEEWRDALGDPTRTGDWLNFFEREMITGSWPDVLARWWPRLLPGIAAGATHGVIRVGHAVRALLTPPDSAHPSDRPGPALPRVASDAAAPSSPSSSAAASPLAAFRPPAARVAELGQALAYWAARWQPMALPGSGPYRTTDPRSALDAVPRVPDQRFGIRSRLAQLADLPAWPDVPTGRGKRIPAGPSPAPSGSPTVPFLNGRDSVPAEPPAVGEIPSAARLLAADENTVHDRLLAIIEAAVVRQAGYGYANPVMLVHAATAPTAVLRTLPALPGALHLPSLAAAWAATAAVTSAYAPAQPRPVTPRPGTRPEDLMAYAADNGDAHAIKLADAAIEAGDAETLARAYRALERFAP
ncbi:questin oxidase family protein [Actinoplanes hulinensis]|uniref:Questin oxidase family protein n=1 Tax=Actinoplanes hulinensis TaxID=1144547 RepID=A0ABS7BGV7_9ACTN|nr:questin oxidase family protein [Actinoplanes hulinensis]MBW6440105.1 questin oxidase family protein [Actinoplanes hulinensis]